MVVKLKVPGEYISPDQFNALDSEIFRRTRRFLVQMREIAPDYTSVETWRYVESVVHNAISVLWSTDPYRHEQLENAVVALRIPANQRSLEIRYAEYARILRESAKVNLENPWSRSGDLISIACKLRDECDEAFNDLTRYRNAEPIGMQPLIDALPKLRATSSGGSGKTGFFHAAAELALSVGAFESKQIPGIHEIKIDVLKDRIKKACTKQKKASAKDSKPRE